LIKLLKKRIGVCCSSTKEVKTKESPILAPLYSADGILRIDFGYLLRIKPEWRRSGIAYEINYYAFQIRTEKNVMLSIGFVLETNVASTALTKGLSIGGGDIFHTIHTIHILENKERKVLVPEKLSETETVHEWKSHFHSMVLAHPEEEVLRTKYNIGCYRLRKDDSEAMCSVWNPEYAMMEDPKGNRSPYWIVYNISFSGPQKYTLLNQILDYIGDLGVRSGSPFTLVDCWKEEVDDAVKHRSIAKSCEFLLGPNYMCKADYEDYFLDPREWSTLLLFSTNFPTSKF